MDTGPIVAQAAVPVLFGDDEATLAARVLVEEHRLLCEVLSWFADGRVELLAGEGPSARSRVRVAPADAVR
jgi:phosphoribosylglycinamide formyltransferase-1